MDVKMKNQIRKLEKQSGIELYGLGKDRANWEASLQKFAELIIDACVDNLHNNGYDDAATQIQKHFGDD